MAIQSYFDEFKQNYEKPQVDGLIVGFSGIDPQRKSSGDNSYNNSTLSQEQKDIVRQLIREALSVIDFSDCTCNPTQLSDEQKDIITQLIEQKLEELNVCNCDNSNLTLEQKEIVRNIINDRLQDFILNLDSGNINGDDDDKPAYEPVDESNLNHEKLQKLLGGNSDGHFHLTQDELLKLASYPPFSQIKHETLPDLMGGLDNEHFHLNSNQFRKLDILINTFFPDGSDKVIIVPNAPYSPDNPDNIDNNPDDYDPYGGLPSGTPPDWELRMLPSNMEAADYGKVFFYGNLRADNENKLFAQLKSSGGLQHTYSTNNAASWTYEKDVTTGMRYSCADAGIFQYVFMDNPPAGLFAIKTGNPTYTWHVAVIPNVANSGKLSYFYRKVISTGSVSFQSTYITPEKNANYRAACYSPLLQKFIVAADDKYCYLKTKDSQWDYWHLGVNVNQGCAAWHPTTAVFCLSAPEGTLTSFDGEHWTLNSDAPHDLRELTYRDDLGNFVAWSGEDKTFYASTDGINWTQLSDTPIPLDNISTVHYAPSLQWYCAVGINAPYAYFSKDLKHWIGTKLRNNSNVDVADVIFMPSTGSFVAMPTSGTYYYTFNPSAWTE